MTVFLLLVGLVGLGAWERARRDVSRAAVPIRIHVNGTRGKSTVARLVAGALRAGGIRTVGKTTGTAPRLILPDGAEMPLRRRAPASIREQLWVLREARRLGAQALVVECMAVDPDLQDVSEREMIGATIGVITNARPDHGEVMGDAADDVAAALSRTVPHDAVLALGPDAGPWREPIEREARRRRTTLLASRADDPAVAGLPLKAWQHANVAVALAVSRHVGVPDEVAIRGMLAAVPDPGALTTRTVAVGSRLIHLVDASAANDPESLGQLVGRLDERDLVIFNHRADRPLRLWQFVRSGLLADPRLPIVLTGDRPDWWSATRARHTLGRAELPFARIGDLASRLRRELDRLPSVSTVVLAGNSKRLDASALAADLGD